MPCSGSQPRTHTTAAPWREAAKSRSCVVYTKVQSGRSCSRRFHSADIDAGCMNISGESTNTAAPRGANSSAPM